MKHSLVTLVFASAVMTTAANAADLLEIPMADAPMVDAMFDWSGLYVGLQGGLVSGNVETEDIYCILNPDDCYGGNPNDRYFSDVDLSGYKVGAHVGYDQQFGMLVLGAETDINIGDGSHEGGYFYYNSTDDELNDGNELESATFELLWQGSARVKAGLALDRFMPYATAGLAYGQADASDHREFDPPRDHQYDGINLIGYTVGLGLAYAATDDIIIRAEGRYTDFGSVDATGISGTETQATEIVGPAIASIEAGISFKF